MDQWNRTQSQEADPHEYSQWIVDEGAWPIKWSNGPSTCKKKKKKKFKHRPHTHETNNSKWIMDLNIKCKSINFLEDNIREHLDELGYDDDF